MAELPEQAPSTAPEDDAPEPEETRSPARGLLRDVIETGLIALVVWLLITRLVPPYEVLGPSMLPTLQEGERLLVSRLAYWSSTPQRGDIVIFHPPQDPQGTPLVKRVIGLPGDVIEVHEQRVILNGEPLDEPYLPPGTATIGVGSWEVPAGEYFVMGDNRPSSSDSRRWGTAPLDLIIGKAWIVYWPPARWGAAPHYQFAAP